MGGASRSAFESMIGRRTPTLEPTSSPAHRLPASPAASPLKSIRRPSGAAVFPSEPVSLTAKSCGANAAHALPLSPSGAPKRGVGMARGAGAGGKLRTRCSSAAVPVIGAPCKLPFAAPSVVLRRQTAGSPKKASLEGTTALPRPHSSPGSRKNKTAPSRKSVTARRHNAFRLQRSHSRRSHPFALKNDTSSDDEDDGMVIVRYTIREGLGDSSSVSSISSSEALDDDDTSGDDGFDCPPMDVDFVSAAVRGLRPSGGAARAGKVRRRSAAVTRKLRTRCAPSPVIRPQRAENIPGHFVLPLQAGLEDTTESLLTQLNFL